MVSAGWTVGEALRLESGRVDWGSEYITDSVTLREAPSPSWAIRIREVDLVVSLTLNLFPNPIPPGDV